MDIRSFFGGSGGKKTSKSTHEASASSSNKKAESPVKKRSEKKRLDIEELSDGEDPIPRQIRDKLKMTKRKIFLSSDSEDDVPRSAPKQAKKSSPSPQKPTKNKKARVVLDSESDESPAKNSTTSKSVKGQTSRNKKSKTPEPEEIQIEDDSDIEMYSDSDEDQLVRGTDKKQKGKKSLPAGQKKLEFSKAAPTSTSSKPKESEKKKSEMTRVNPADFFGSSTPSVAKKTKETPAPAPKKDASVEKAIEKEKTKSKAPTPVKAKESPKKASKTISPSQKENTKKKADAEDEFVDSDDSFDFVPIVKKAKKAETPTPKKEEKKEEKKQPLASASKKTETPEKKKTVEKAKASVPAPVKIASKPSSSHSSSKAVPSSQESKDSGIGSSQSSSSSASARAPPPKPAVEPTLPWVDKYKPKSLSQLVGQHGEKSPMNKLMDWLKDWAKHNLGEGAKIKKPKPAPWMAQQDGTPFKAALMSGTPGVGKTTCAYMACEALGLKMVEMNASDVRSKKHLEAKVGELSGTHQLEQYFGGGKAVAQDNFKVHHVLIMDEVDGMSGNEDRAGVAELIQIIKESKIPIICICNDRMHPKIRSLANYCYDLRFSKPRVEQIRARMMTICAQEKFKIGKDELDQIIELSGHDVRQTIYNLQMRSTSTDSKSTVAKKDVSVGPFDAARRLLDTRTDLREKNEMFFVDYGIMPLFVQENYLNMRNDKHTPLEAIRGLRKAADMISLGDNIDRQIRAGGSWKLLNEQSMISCALPAIATGGHLRAMIQFPSWLGKNSTAGKRKRLLTQLVMHTHLKVSASTHSFATDYAPILRSRITKPLLDRENDGVSEVIDTMKEYDLIKDDCDALSEIVVWPGKIDPASKILSKVKATLTRTLNKESRMLPYSLDEIARSKKQRTGGDNLTGFDVDEDGNIVEKYEDDEDSDDDSKPTSSEVVVKSSTGGGAVKATRGGRGGSRGATRGGRGRGAKK